jgi:hypothetical protein
MYSSSKGKRKPKIDPMNLDFDFMIKNHSEFFTKLSSQNIEHTPSQIPTRPPPASGDFSSRPPSVLDGYPARGGGGRRVRGLGATLKPKIYPPTLMRNAKPKRLFK